MSTTIERLAQWARDLTAADLPAAVATRARLQHLSVAGAVRSVRERPVAAALRKAGPARGAVPVATGGTSSRRGAAALHAGLSCWLDHDDYLFLGHTGHGAVPAAWASARRHTLDELVTATVAADEIAGRIGASLLLGPENGQGWLAVTSAAATVAAGLLDGLDATALAHALALTLAAPTRTSRHALLGGGDAKALLGSVPAVQGVDAVDAVQAGMRGPLDLLDRDDGFFHGMAWVPLRSAFTGLGSAWLTETLAYKLVPGSAYLHVPVQAVLEILSRHVKAADKRLRADQVERIEVTTNAPGWVLERLMSNRPDRDPAAVSFAMRRAIAVAVVAHELTPTVLEPGWLEANAGQVDELTAKIEVRHDWGRTMALLDHFTRTAAPLLAGLTLADLRKVGHQARVAYGAGLPGPGRAELLAIVKARPDALFERVRRAEPDLAQARLGEWQFRFDTEVRLHTTRGGTWPERRTIPEGSPGWPWDDTVARVLAKRTGDDSRALFGAAGGTAADEWAAALLA